ncbi:MAG: K+/H+ antiporter subunit F [Myxococcales bacterium]
MSSLLSFCLSFSLGCLALSMAMALLRMLIGPSAQDRVLAFDCFYASTMLAILALGLRYRSSSYFEAALLIALFGFVGSTAMSKFLLRGEVVE